MALIEQEMTMQRYIDIPGEVMDIYKTYRATPLIRAYRLEDKLDTPAKIYYKYEGATPSGSHKFNTAIPQAYYNKAAGMRRISTETGAGQWGTALSIACKMFGLDCTVYMVKISAQQKPYRKSIMETFGAEVFASPSMNTNAGRGILASDPLSPGSLGIAITEAVEDAATHSDTNYSLGSVLNHVALHQTIIGQEAMTQMEMIGEYPDIVIGCCGGGSNFSGIAFPFVKNKLEGKRNTRFLAVEPTACPTLTRGKFAYDYGDTGKMTPIIRMYTLGHGFIPDGIHAGGLRYHGDSPLLSQLCRDGFIDAVAVNQTDVFRAATLFAHTEGILPAPESSHAILVAIEEAEKCKQTGEEKTILFNLSGHGHFDLTAYDAYNSGKIIDVPFSEEKLVEGLAELPLVN
jgi:tryptophan synthase beta chain